MDKKTGDAPKLVFFQSNDAESLFRLPEPALEASDSSSSIPSDFSPFRPPFSGSCLNSPILDKHEMNRGQSPPMTQISLVPFQVTAKIRKRSRTILPNKDKVPYNGSGQPPKGQQKTQKFGDSIDKTKIVDAFEKSAISLSNGQGLTAESTALGSGSYGLSSHLKNSFGSNLTFEDFESCHEPDEFGLPPIALSKLQTIYKLLCAFFNGENCESIVEELSEDFEFQLLGILFTYLKLSYKATQKTTLKQKLSLLLKSQPKRPRKRRKMIQLIFTQVAKLLQIKFANTQLGVSGQDYYNHYFAQTGDYTADLEKEFNVTYNLKSHNISYGFVTKCLQSKTFQIDFVRLLNEEYIGFYDSLRRQRLYSLLLKWEGLMATSKNLQGAIESIKGEITARSFRIAWTNSELQSYFGFFQGLSHSGSTV